MKILKRKKFTRLYEDDETQNQQNINQQQTSSTDTNNQQAQQNQNQNNANQQQDNLNQQQNNQQQNQQQTAAEQSQNLEKMQGLLKNITNVYWAISNNIPEEIQKVFPDFKQGNQKADPIIKLWNDFKANPDEGKFNTFINAFKNYGSETQNESLNINILKNIEKRRAILNFRNALSENLSEAKRNKKLNNIAKAYFNN